MEILTLVSYFALGALGGFLGATVGGGGLIMIPYLMFTGLAPQVAVASARFGDIGMGVVSSYKYWREGSIVWRYVPLLAVLSLGGSLVGANILLAIEADSLRKVAAVLLFALLPVVLFKKELGTVRREVGRLSKGIAASLFLLIETVTGFFAAGTGPLKYYTLVIGFGLTIVEAVATQMLPYLVLAVSSTIVFAMHGLIDYKAGLLLLAGNGLGGYLGAHVAIVKGSVWIKRLFVVMVVAAGVKLLFF